MDSTQLQLTFQQLEAPVLADLKNNDVVPALLGPPGIGKSEFLKALARKKHTKVFVLSMNQLADRADLTGARLLKDEKTNTYGQFFFPHATIMEAIEYAKNRPNEEPILFLDEFNRTTSDVTSATMTFITERRVGTTDFPENLRMVIAGNDQGNVVNIDDASVTRIVVYHAQPDTETFLNVNPDINPFIRDVLIKNPTYLTSDKNKD
jgi:MoxR-like ATPase